MHEHKSHFLKFENSKRRSYLISCCNKVSLCLLLAAMSWEEEFLWPRLPIPIRWWRWSNTRRLLTPASSFPGIFDWPSTRCRFSAEDFGKRPILSCFRLRLFDWKEKSHQSMWTSNLGGGGGTHNFHGKNNAIAFSNAWFQETTHSSPKNVPNFFFALIKISIFWTWKNIWRKWWGQSPCLNI